MELRAMLLFCSILFCNKIAADKSAHTPAPAPAPAPAQTPAWILQPNVCIAQKVDSECALSLSIKTKNMPTEILCLYLDEQLLACSQQAYFPRKIYISIQQDTLLALKNKAHKTILSKKLLIKYSEPNKQRRRIRQPWSLF
jgi:hypothetical protein